MATTGKPSAVGRRDGYIEVYAPTLGRIVRICLPCVRSVKEEHLADALGIALSKRHDQEAS